MQIILIVIVLGLVMIAGVVWLRLARRKRGMRIMLAQCQKVTDAAMRELVATLRWPVQAPVGSAPVADVWGHGIMAFAYELPDPSFVVTPARLNHTLKGIAAAKGLTVGNPTVPVFMVTDLWQRDGGTHIDVAYMVNAATIAYAQDVARV